MAKREDVSANEYVARLERVARIATTIYMVSNNVENRGITCPHGEGARYPAHAWWCDDCFWELEEALAWVTPDALPKNKPEVELPELAQLQILRRQHEQAVGEERYRLAGILRERLEKALRAAGYEKLSFPAVPTWQHPTKGGFYC